MVLAAALVDRVRQALGTRPTVREVKMFGGLAFMVDDRMVVHVRSDGDLLVRVAAHRADELLAREGAGTAEMGAGRPMSKNWISVGPEALATDEDLHTWLCAALEFHSGASGRTSGRRHREGSASSP